MIVIAAGQRVGDRYLLDRRIAVGGMGEVWEASDSLLGRSVAVKILRPELSGDPEFLHRFRIEARTVASLDHDGIAAVHDYGESDGVGGRRTAYLVMELVRGEPLSTHIARGPIEPNETMRLLEEAAWALQAAHERGFVHRDVKPGNILVRTDGKVKLTDFGIAKAADAVPVTRSGMVMGTAHYIAPEQASGAEAGPAGDVYSLGIVGYECLVGHRPFRAESAVAVAMMQVRDEPPPLPETVPISARELIEATLVKDPTMRYATGGEFAAAVAAIRRGEAVPMPAALAALQVEDKPSTGFSGWTRKNENRRSAPAHPGAGKTGAGRISIRRGGSSPVDTPPPAARDNARATQTRTPARPSRPPQPPPAPLAPLRLQPVARSGRTLLLVLFVLLTLAALILGVFILRAGVTGIGDSPLWSMSPGSVSGWEGVMAGWIVSFRSVAPRAGLRSCRVGPANRRVGTRGRTVRSCDLLPSGMMTTAPDTLRNPQR